MTDSRVCPFLAIYCVDDAPLARPVLAELERLGLLLFPRWFGLVPWPQRWRLREDKMERSTVVLLFWSARASRDENACYQINRAIDLGYRFTVVCLDDAPMPGLPRATAEYHARLRFLAGHQWYGWLKQFAREIGGALAAAHALSVRSQREAAGYLPARQREI
ncbi:MAG: hypothetical protein JNL98_17010 [Bryobacterales bacterium]|nr:hypothetical protein [Bryobacterales bacterium]